MDFVAKVGLQLLLEPQASTLFFRAACNTAGVIYPVYASFKALETSAAEGASQHQRQKQLPEASGNDNQQWLTYWAVYGIFSLLEDKGDQLLRVLPYYWHAKLGFLLWLMLPQTQGARMLYVKYMRPTLQRFSPKIDVIIQRGKAVLSMVYTLYKVPIDTTLAFTIFGMAQIKEFLVWFVNTDNSKSSDPSSKTGPQFITS